MKIIEYKVSFNGFDVNYTTRGVTENQCLEAINEKIRKDLVIEKVKEENTPETIAERIKRKYYTFSGL